MPNVWSRIWGTLRPLGPWALEAAGRQPTLLEPGGSGGAEPPAISGQRSSRDQVVNLIDQTFATPQAPQRPYSTHSPHIQLILKGGLGPKGPEWPGAPPPQTPGSRKVGCLPAASGAQGPRSGLGTPKSANFEILKSPEATAGPRSGLGTQKNPNF